MFADTIRIPLSHFTAHSMAGVEWGVKTNDYPNCDSYSIVTDVLATRHTSLANSLH
jgi:hypothetical protein